MEKVFGFFSPFFIYIFIFILNAILPGRWVTGYVSKPDSSEKLKYRLNGLLVLFVVLITWIILCYTGVLEWDWLYQYRWHSLAGAITFGVIFSYAIVLPFPAIKRSFLADFYLGRLENPQLWGGRIDAKIWLYMVGAIMLELNTLNFAAHNYLVFGAEASAGVFVAAAFLSFFAIEYLFFEEVHLYTYDFLAERVGFKLGWGDLAFYPYFYAIVLWAAADMPDPQTPAYLMLIYGLIFLSGWFLSRGANMQKYTFKKNPEKSFLGIKPIIITDGHKSLLISGFWGFSRHINYLGEILMATGIVLCAGHSYSIWPWLYPLYYVALLFPRQRADDKICAHKYGELWEQYVKKVPYKIIPYIY